MFSTFFENVFLQMALWASLLASLATGVIGSFVVVKRISFIAGSIAHSVLGGMGLCLWLQRSIGWQWADPLLGAFAAAILSALSLGWVQLKYRQREDAVIAAIWSTGMAIGIIFVSLTPGANVELLSYLFGNILWIEGKDLVHLALLDGLILTVVFVYYKKFLSICFDEEQAKLQGIATTRLYLLLLCLVAISIVLLMQVVGTILVIAMLTIPATLAALLTNQLSKMMGIAAILCALFCLLGLWVAASLDWPPAATIALLSAISYLAFLLYTKNKKNPYQAIHLTK